MHSFHTAVMSVVSIFTNTFYIHLQMVSVLWRCSHSSHFVSLFYRPVTAAYQIYYTFYKFDLATLCKLAPVSVAAYHCGLYNAMAQITLFGHSTCSLARHLLQLPKLRRNKLINL